MKQLLLAAVLAAFAGSAQAAKWRVEITNTTRAQSFTPILAATHYGDSGLPGIGAPASEALAMLAEGGDTVPLGDELTAATGSHTRVRTIDGLLEPGQTRVFTVRGRPGQRLTLAAMLIPTNDTFFAVSDAYLPIHGRKVVYGLGYDAGSEANSQRCGDIPGPRCGGAGYSPGMNEGDEGFVHVSNGFHELGTGGDGPDEILSPVTYSWNNPVAIVTIRRVHGSH